MGLGDKQATKREFFMDSHSKIGKGMATGVPPRDFNPVTVDAEGEWEECTN